MGKKLSPTVILFSKVWNSFSKAWNLFSKLWKVDYMPRKIFFSSLEKYFLQGAETQSYRM